MEEYYQQQNQWRTSGPQQGEGAWMPPEMQERVPMRSEQQLERNWPAHQQQQEWVDTWGWQDTQANQNRRMEYFSQQPTQWETNWNQQEEQTMSYRLDRQSSYKDGAKKAEKRVKMMNN